MLIFWPRQNIFGLGSARFSPKRKLINISAKMGNSFELPAKFLNDSMAGHSSDIKSAIAEEHLQKSATSQEHHGYKNQPQLKNIIQYQVQNSNISISTSYCSHIYMFALHCISLLTSNKNNTHITRTNLYSMNQIGRAHV